MVILNIFLSNPIPEASHGASAASAVPFQAIMLDACCSHPSIIKLQVGPGPGVSKIYEDLMVN